MLNAIAHPPSEGCPAHPRAGPGTSQATPPVYTLAMTPCGLEYLLGQFRSAVLAVSPPAFLRISSLAQHGKLRSPKLRVSTAQQQLKPRCAVSIILQNSPEPTTRRKVNSIPAETVMVAQAILLPYTGSPL